MLGDVSVSRSSDAGKIDAPVLLEMLVFNGGYGVVENPGALLVSHEDAALKRKTADKLAIVSINFGNDVGPVSFERANFGEIAGVDEQESTGRTQSDGAEEQKRQSDAIDQLPATQAEGDWGET